MAGNIFSGSPFWIADPLTGQPGGIKVQFGGVDAGAQGDNADGTAVSATANKQQVAARNYYFNGTTWDRARGNTDGSFVVAVPSAVGPALLTHSRIATADTNATVVKAAKAILYAYQFFNATATARYVKLYNKATAPTVGTDVPVRRLIIPPNGLVAFHAEEGLGAFTAGLAYAITGALADADTTAVAAGDVVVNIDYF